MLSCVGILFLSPVENERRHIGYGSNIWVYKWCDLLTKNSPDMNGLVTQISAVVNSRLLDIGYYLAEHH